MAAILLGVENLSTDLGILSPVCAYVQISKERSVIGNQFGK